jgi:hypothetical protein
MNKEAWLKFIPRSKEAHHIREIFNGTYSLIGMTNVQEMFFKQIDKLLGEIQSEHTRKSLEDLREDIELEIEHGAMRSKIIVRPKANSQAFYLTEKEKFIKIIDTLESEIEKLREMIETNQGNR